MDSVETQCYLLLLPNDVQILILKLLGPDDLCCLSLTCKAFNEISSRDYIWKPFGNPNWSEAQSQGWKAFYLNYLRKQISSAYALQKEMKKPAPSTPNPNYNFLLRILIIGDSGVGKTSVVHRYVENFFQSYIVNHYGVDFRLRTLMIGDMKVKLQIWDTAGVERFRRVMTPSYYRNTHGIFFAYSITDATSFKNVTSWMADAALKGKNVDIALIGCKKDLSEERVVTTEEAQKFVESQQGRISMFREVSAKTGEGVHDTFDTFAAELLKKMQMNPLFLAAKYTHLAWPIYLPNEKAVERMIGHRKEEEKIDTQTPLRWQCNMQ